MKATVMIKKKYRTGTVRLEGFDYGIDGAYFITVCSYKKQQIFSEIVNGAVLLSPLGEIINEEFEKTHRIRKYATVTDWIIMPNHFHCVIFIHKDSDEPQHLAPYGSYLYFPEGYKNRFGPQRENLASIVRGIKSAVTTRAKISGIPTPIWQPNYYEHIVRNQKELERIVLYVKQNPFAWEQDANFSLLDRDRGHDADFPDNM